jgi:hypothetical protein
VYHVSNLRIAYRSGLRLRRTTATTDICELVLPPDRRPGLMKQVEAVEASETDLYSVDPLVGDYERTCNAPFISP